MKGKLALKYLTSNEFCLTPDYLEMMISIAQDTKNIDIQESNVNTLEIDGNVAIISVDGAMVKRGDFFSNVCGMTSYAKIEKQIAKAENTDGVDTLLFVVDTPGGDVAGVDNVGEKIFNSKLKTVTLYENIGASGGIWAFSGSNEVYATETTQLGSIGVIYATQVKAKDGTKKIEILSKNAPNKRCNIEDKSCQNKVKTRIDNIESIFLSRVERNTNLSREEIINGFNHGDVISATQAQKIGFINGITTKDKLLSKLKGDTQMTKTEKKTLSLLASHDTDEKQTELTALLATFGVNAVWGETDSKVEEIEEKATQAIDDSKKVSALLASTQVLSESEKINCISEGKTFDEISAMVLEKERGDLESLDTKPQEVAQEELAAKAMLEYAQNNQIKG